MIALVVALLVTAQAWEVSIESVSRTTVAINVVNVFDQAITFSVWGTPLDKSDDVLRADFFRAADQNGNTPLYVGILERKVPTQSDFITLQPQQKVQTSIDLTKGYWFQEIGEYKLHLEAMVRVRFGELEEGLPDLSTFDWQPMTSNSVTVQVTSVLSAPYWWGLSTKETVGNPAPRNCTNQTQVNQINQAGANAITATQQGLRYLPAGACTGKNGYITWFGACAQNRYDKVRNCLSSVITNLQYSYPVQCGGSSCTANTYAYVFPTDTTHTVYVCAVFWRVPTANCVMDSQPGTLIHEMSHFNNVCATSDVTYGQTNCKNLAISNPTNACNNADNYCFYTDSCYN